MTDPVNPRSALSELQPYEPGKPVDEIAREYDLDEDPVKLASNENPYSPPEALRSTYEAEFEDLNRYPDGGAYHLRKALSQKYNWPMEGVVIGAGSDEITDFLARAFLEPGDEVVLSDPSFVRHSMLPRMMGAVPRTIPVTDEYDHDLEGMLDAINERTCWVFVPNPNNPTSRYVSGTRLRSFLNELPDDLVVILDEAYSEFMDQADFPDGRELVDEFDGPDDPTIILQRTFSKAYGLAGLRVGYGLIPPEMARQVHKVRPPFNVTRPAQAVATQALDCTEYIRESRKKIQDERERLLEGLHDLDVGFVPPSANFFLLEVPDRFEGSEFCEELMKRGVIVRSMIPYDLDRHVRVSVGTPRENDRFLGALEDLLG
jgi:histidinol-phosphate aminotransferase